MKRSLILRVLLSPLLLVSQQMAVGHAMSHWTGAADKPAQVQAGATHAPSKALAHDASCAQCFAYAQLASALGSPAYRVPVLSVQAFHLVSPIPSADCLLSMRCRSVLY